MPTIWGMDEAGYGPNLGPLVVALTAWEVPSLDFDFWSHLDGCVSAHGTQNQTRLHIADSKAVHNPAQGLAPLETSAAPLLSIVGYAANDLLAMVLDGHGLTPRNAQHDAQSPSYFTHRVLPVEAPKALVAQRTAEFQAGLERSAVSCCGIWARVIWPKEFNQLLKRHGNKSNVLTHVSLQLLGAQWSVDSQYSQRVHADRHGGRKFYAGPLQELIGDRAFVSTVAEAKESSRYRIASTEFEFAERSERYFPVAAASLVAKYLRELAMLEFNAFWVSHQPGVKPTKGYPEDAKRFLREIRESIDRLQIPMNAVWRER